MSATALELGEQPGEFTTLPVTPSDLFGKETLILDDGSYVCRPAGLGPFPVVLYNHGGKGNEVGGDLHPHSPYGTLIVPPYITLTHYNYSRYNL